MKKTMIIICGLFLLFAFVYSQTANAKFAPDKSKTTPTLNDNINIQNHENILTKLNKGYYQLGYISNKLGTGYFTSISIVIDFKKRTLTYILTLESADPSIFIDYWDAKLSVAELTELRFLLNQADIMNLTDVLLPEDEEPCVDGAYKYFNIVANSGTGNRLEIDPGVSCNKDYWPEGLAEIEIFLFDLLLKYQPEE